MDSVSVNVRFQFIECLHFPIYFICQRTTNSSSNNSKTIFICVLFFFSFILLQCSGYEGPMWFFSHTWQWAISIFDIISLPLCPSLALCVCCRKKSNHHFIFIKLDKSLLILFRSIWILVNFASSFLTALNKSKKQCVYRTLAVAFRRLNSPLNCLQKQISAHVHVYSQKAPRMRLLLRNRISILVLWKARKKPKAIDKNHIIKRLKKQLIDCVSSSSGVSRCTHGVFAICQMD